MVVHPGNGIRVVGLRGHLRATVPLEIHPEGEQEHRQDDIWVRAALLRSPHSLQVYEEDLQSVLEARKLCRILSSAAPRRAYRRRTADLKTVVHWGQRKLLLSEIEFLTRYGEGCARVLYAGAAPGTHIPFLATLFPQFTFVLVDPGEFKISSSQVPSIEVRREFFSATLAEKLREPGDGWGTSKTLFISDVRTADSKIHNAMQVDAKVLEDMRMQQEWVRILRPRRAMLKFRLPYAPGETEYLDGEIFLPVWGPPTTTEARLVTDGQSVRSYDHTAYEEQMAFFNTVTRISRYPTPMVGHGLDECFDCASEMAIFQAYLASLAPELRKALEGALNVEDRPPSEASLDPLLVVLFRRTGQKCSSSGGQGRSLMTVLRQADKEKWYEAKVFDAATGRHLAADSEEGQHLLQLEMERLGVEPAKV